MKLKISNLLLLFILLSSAASLNAQSVTGVIKGKVIDTNNKPVFFATVALLNAETKSVEKGVICDENGIFSIDKVNKGSYILSVRMVGYETNESETAVVDHGNMMVEKTVILKEAVEKIGEVVVRGKYDLMEQQVDKTVINPNASVLTESESVYEILKKTPGINIDNDENITIKGLQGVMVLIDGKPTYLAGNELAPVLKGMIAKNIKSIEIIENPSSRFDAEGNSGIINIVTKHNKAPGLNGNAYTGVTASRKFGWNGGADLNMNYGKVNLYANYNYYNWEGWHKVDATRRFTSESMNGAYQLIKSIMNSEGSSHNYKAGADYYIADDHVLSFMVRGNNGQYLSNDKGTTDFTDSDMNPDSLLSNVARQENLWNNQTYNLNYKWDIDTLGRSLTVDADYARFYFGSDNGQTSKFFDAAGNDLNQDISLTGFQKGNIDILSAKIDYIHPVSRTLLLEAGIKSSYVITDSRVNLTGYMSQDDNFIYREAIQAGYISGRKSFSKTTVQAGLRVENTISSGESVSANSTEKKSYLKFFPTLFIQQTLTEKQSLGLRYSYRIGRPNYHMLNPFVWVLDPYTRNIGNPQLKPQFTHSMSLNHSYAGMLNTSVGMNYTRDLFSDVIYQDEETKVMYQTMDNLGRSIDLNMSETVQLQPAGWWSLSGTVTGMYKEISITGEAGRTFRRWSYSANIRNSFSLPLNVGMEISGRYSSKQLYGNFILEPSYTFDMGFKRNLLKDKGVLKVSLSDIFLTYSNGAYARYEGIDIEALNLFDSRKVNVSFTYRFGKNDFKTRSGRSTASSEEQSRSNK